jgi:hypothetical protein
MRMLVGNALLLLTVATPGAQKPLSIEGVWKIAERTVPGGNARANGVAQTQNSPRPNLLIFTKGYYSELIEMGVSPRPQVAPPANPQRVTDAEKIAFYDQWRPFTANAGTYEISGSVLNRHPIVAKNLDVMNRGTNVPFQLRFEGPDIVWLIPTGDFAAREPQLKLRRLE